jgi:hypothetical protein
MKTVLQAVLFAGLVMPAFSAISEVDFDGKHKEHRDIAAQSKTYAINSPTASVSEKNNILPAPKEETVGEVNAILQARSVSGEWVTLQPESEQNDGRDSYYVFLPEGQEIRSSYKCSAGPWSVSSSFLIQPSFGGHEHSKNIPPLAHTPQGAPVPPAQLSDSNLPANTWNTFIWTAPKYGTRVIETATFGNCTGKITKTIDFKAQDLYPMGYGTGYALAFGNSGSHSQIWNVHELFEPKLTAIGSAWNQTCSKSAVLLYERMSLPWGGLFDLEDDWSMPAWLHDRGTTADVSKIDVIKGNRKKLIEMMCQYVSVDNEIYSEKDPSHYHISLRGVPHKQPGWQACCPKETGAAAIPQACIDLAPGFNETLPVESDCQ